MKIKSNGIDIEVDDSGPGASRPAVLRALLRRPADHRQAAAVAHYVKLFKLIGSPAFPMPELDLRERIEQAFARGFYPVGTLRQTLAVVADTTRAAQLSKLRVPTLVVHGQADPLVPYACGEDTARRIPGAQLGALKAWATTGPPVWCCACWTPCYST